MIEDKYINAIEEIVMEPECESFTEEQRTEIRNVLYSFQQDIKSRVSLQSVASFRAMLDEAFKGSE